MILHSTQDSPDPFNSRIRGFLLPESDSNALLVLTDQGTARITSDGLTGEAILYGMLRGEALHVHMEVVS